jgi:hypothetical protein
MTEDMTAGQRLGGFCVVANVAEETARGEGGLELSRGVRHFAAGIIPRGCGAPARRQSRWQRRGATCRSRHTLTTGPSPNEIRQTGHR